MFPWYHLNSQPALCTHDRITPVKRKSLLISAFQLKSDLLLPCLTTCTTRDLSKSTEKNTPLYHC